MIKFSWVLACLFSSSLWASALVCIDKNTNDIEIYSHYYFYGPHADDKYAKPCIDEVNGMFNGFTTMLNHELPWRKVNFHFSYSVISLDQAFQYSKINHSASVNLVRLDTLANNGIGISQHDIKNNSGYFIIENDLGRSTTCTHEIAHGLGLDHYEPCDFRGKGKPGIMANRGCLVDKKYQWNKEAKAGENGGTVNPKNRVVLASEISGLKLGDLNFKNNFNNYDCANLGYISNFIYNHVGEKVKVK